MAESSFNVGDVVQLKSGGPAMTITSFKNNGQALCQWFDKNNEKQAGAFEQSALRKHNPPPPHASTSQVTL